MAYVNIFLYKCTKKISARKWNKIDAPTGWKRLWKAQLCVFEGSHSTSRLNFSPETGNKTSEADATSPAALAK